ncbi:MAG TPA: hypothetical protein VFD92_24155 [Candidatus Binatia bacterium]|nr:hypothetical protein [Candidatus Binatia bacterium]
MDQFTHIADTGALNHRIPIVSSVEEVGRTIEMVYDPKRRKTAFAVWQDEKWTLELQVDGGPNRKLVPYSPYNNLIRNRIILFPSGPEEYGNESELVGRIQTFIHRYVDVTPLYERIAAYYVLFSWLYDGFNELPYLRVRGDPGSGKTRFLLTVGSLCYKPIFASGASTVSPLFRLLDTFRGTLIIDEGDFRVSDEKAEVVKILNNGNARGFPVLRSQASDKGEFNPRAYQVFGPKIVATRGYFQDRALESRFITEEMGGRRLRNDIPINQPVDASDEAEHLRNQLLLFRFRNRGKRVADEALVDRSVEPRLNQVFVPLLSVIDDPDTKRELHDVARRYHREMVAERALDTEAQILEVISELSSSPGTSRVSVGDVTRLFTERHGEDYDRKVTSKWIGTILRRRLGFRPAKSHGTFIITPEELSRLPLLRERYGLDVLDDRVDMGDVGDVPEVA